MKKDKLYTVNKWNQPMFSGNGITTDRTKNIFWPGGPINYSLADIGGGNLIGGYNSNPSTNGLTLDSNLLENIQLKQMLGNGNSGNAVKSGINTGNILGTAATAVSPILSSAIGGGYSTGGVGEGIAGVGNAVGSAVGGPWGAVISAGSSILGGLTNRAFGTKENKTNINTLEQNVAQAQNAGNALAGSTTSSDFINSAGMMTTGTGFGTKDLVKGGWFSKGKARRKGQKYLDKEANALAMQNQGMVTGANNVDSYMDDAVMSNFAAFGGPLDYVGVTGNNENMGAIEYGLMSDFLNTKQRQAENKNNMGNLFAGMPGSMFALGGVLQSHGADWGDGLTIIGAGGSHEENPNEGIQMGVDPQGTPNLVEENETVYNDYVYSNRIFADGGTLKKFHLPKKAKLTYADITKKLEKEIKERPNDPISKAAFKAQMEDLANEQERQKQEMEAARTREAFEALSPEEQVEVMQYAQQQEQAQQEAAMQEQAMAEQQAVAQQQPSPEEMTMMQQQMQGQPMIGEGYAYGGNLFALGGDDDNILISRPAGYSFGYTPSNGVVPASAAYKRVAEVRTENRQATPKMFKGKPLPKRKGMADSSYAKEMEKAGFNDLEIDEYILGTDGSNHSFTYSPRTKTFKAKKWRNASGEALYSKAEIDAEQKSFASGAKRVSSAKGNQPQAAPKQATKSTSTTNKPVQTAKTQAQDVTTASPRTSIFSSVSNAVDRAYADAQAQAQAKAQTAPAVTTQTTTNPDPFGAEARARKLQDLITTAQAAATSEVPTAEEIPATETTPRRRAAAPSNTNVQTDRGTERNVGDWKNPDENHWDLYTKPGFETYIDNAIARYNMAGTDEARRAIQDEVMNSVNGLQQSYNDVIAPNIGASKYSYRPEVVAHQTKFEDLGGNQGFWPVGEDGSITNVIGNAINLPLGYSTGDNPAGRGIDGYEGPQTTLRHFGSTADGDATYFAPLVDKIRSGLNLNYSPNASWSYGKDGQYQLYGLSRIETPATDGSASPEGPLNAPAAPDTNAGTSVPGRYGNMPWAPENAGNGVGANGSTGNNGVSSPAVTGAGNGDEYDVVPVTKSEWPRYAGLFGPAVGLGMQALGIGRPDTKALDGVLEGYDRTGAALADYKPIGDYLRYSPMDIWAEQNRLNANTRATDRALANNSAPIGTRAAGLLANEYNNQIGSGELYRKALEYNDALRERTATFNRGTNQFNAEAYNRAALQNAEIRNRDRQLRAQLGMQAAAQKADMDAGWYNGIYGNVAGLFKGISDLGRENAQHNMIAKMAADGIFGNMSDKQFTGQGFLKRVPKYTASEGGKIGKKKGKRGLTI